MTFRQMQTFGLAGLIALALTGCGGDPNAPPMTTDGPNQVVLKVPGMS